MTTTILVATLLTGLFDVSGSIGGLAPLGDLEFNHRSGILGSLALGVSLGSSRIEMAHDFMRMPGSAQADYALDLYRLNVGYHYAFVNRADWQLRAGLGLDLNNLARRLRLVTETGAVPGATLALTYARSFGHPRFLFQLFGSELLEPLSAGGTTSLVGATLVGVKAGVGYEF